MSDTRIGDFWEGVARGVGSGNFRGYMCVFTRDPPGGEKPTFVTLRVRRGRIRAAASGKSGRSEKLWGWGWLEKEKYQIDVWNSGDFVSREWMASQPISQEPIDGH